MLCQVAEQGVLVSAHPAVIQEDGNEGGALPDAKDGWGCDTSLLPHVTGVRGAVSPPSRGGQAARPPSSIGAAAATASGRWSCPPLAPARRPALILAGAGTRYRGVRPDMPCGAVSRSASLSASFSPAVEPYFAGSGRIIDQPYQERPAGGDGSPLSRAGQGGRFWTSGDQRPLPGPARRRSGHAPSRDGVSTTRRPSRIQGSQTADGSGVAARHARAARPRHRRAARDLGCRLPLRPEDGHGRGHLCPLRDQRQLGVPFPDEALPALARETRTRLENARRARHA